MGVQVNCFAHAQSVDPRANRSAFEYVDHDAPPASRYDVPKRPLDPTDIRLETLKAQIIELEERIERLEKSCQNNAQTGTAP